MHTVLWETSPLQSLGVGMTAFTMISPVATHPVPPSGLRYSSVSVPLKWLHNVSSCYLSICVQTFLLWRDCMRPWQNKTPGPEMLSASCKQGLLLTSILEVKIVGQFMSWVLLLYWKIILVCVLIYINIKQMYLQMSVFSSSLLPLSYSSMYIDLILFKYC